jgi:bifunctional DNA-binding transcriptional regulator/antitoxin component of YhaV-PrlF toxin-antitoxin module
VPSTKSVEFLARLQVQNRIQIPVEIRQRFKLEPGKFFKAEVQPVEDVIDETFYAKLKPDGRITIPWEIVQVLEFKLGDLLRVRLYVNNEE